MKPPTRAELRRCPLGTPRLVLAPLDAADGRSVFDAVSASRDHLEPRLPWTRAGDGEAARDYCLSSERDWDHGQALRFSIREIATHRFLGVVGFDALVLLHESCDLSYWLRGDAAGAGYMTEALDTAVRWAFSRLGAHRIRVELPSDNGPARRVLGRLGFRLEGVMREANCGPRGWRDCELYARLARDVVR